ncbi:unnamed protein product [Cercospora beticola]|nr:unnamed protein product [Cercospora beticola]
MADLYSPLYKNFHPLSIHKSAVGDELWPDPSNIYRQDPSPAVDEAWENLTHPQYLLATEQDLIRMGKNISTAVRWPEEPDKFLMNLHVYHVMHCLNVLRKNAWQNFPYYL